MLGGLGWPSRTHTGASLAGAEGGSSRRHDDDGAVPASSAPQTPPRASLASSAGDAIGGTCSGGSHSSSCSHGNGHGPSHSRESSLDEASLSDLTSTSYQQPQSSEVGGNTGSSPALSELTEEATGSSASLAHQSTTMPALPSIHVGVGPGMLNLHAIRRPARIASRLESIPSVGYVNSHEEPGDSVHGGHADCSCSCSSNGGASASPPQHRRQDMMGNADNNKFSHHLQRYNDPVDNKKGLHHHQQHHHHHHHHNVSIQTDVTDASTVDESYSESDWSTPPPSQSNLVVSASASTSVSASASASASASRSSSSSTLQGLPHAHGPPHAQPPPPPHPLHTITSFNTSATDGDIDTDLDLDQDEDSLLYHHHHHHHQRSHSQHSQHPQQQPLPLQQPPQDRPLSPVLPAGSMTNRPPSRRGERASSCGGSSSGGSRALSPPTPRSVTAGTTTSTTTPRARSYPQRSQQPPSHPPPPPPSRAGSISRPRYAVEFRHRPIQNGRVAERHHQQHHHHHQPQPHHQPSPVATEAAARAQAEYGRDGRHVERVAMDVDDPYLSHGSSADDWDGPMEEEGVGGSHVHHHHRQNSRRHPPHPKLRRSEGGLAPLPTPTATVVGMDMHGTGSKLMSSLFGTLFRTIRTTLLFGAVGAAVTLLRAHFLLASGGAAVSLVGGGGAAAALASSQGLVAGGGIAAVRLASGALALPRVTDLLLTAAVREAARAERAVLREKVQRPARRLPDGRPVSVPGSGMATATARGGGRRLSTRDGAASANGETYAVRLSTTPGRSDLTDAAVERLAQCSSIADVRLDHTSDRTDDGDLLGGWGDAGSIIKRPGLTTDAVLLLSDGLAFTCEELDRAFDIWSKDSDRMVGFYTYDLVPTETRSASFGLGEISRGKGGYSVISDRAAFVHRSYLTSISAKAAMDAASEWSAKQTTQDSNVQCDSYALSLAVSAVSSKAPISVAAEPLELRSASSSSSKQNSVASSSAECLLGITSALGMQVLPSEERVYVGSE